MASRVCYLLMVSVLVLDVGVAGRRYGKRKQDLDVCPVTCMCHKEEAHCDNMELFHIPLRLPKKLTALHLKNNYVQRVRHLQLQHLTKLRSIVLRNNQINFIEPNAFWGLRQLRSVTLRDNNLRYLPPDLFKGLYNLEEVSFRNNYLYSIEHIFKGLRNLRLLSLSDNQISKITSRTFRSNVRLYVVDLHNNSITYVKRGAFKSLPYLRYLILRDNPLFTISLDFQFNYHLELLDFTNCQLTQMVHGLPLSVRDLRISENNISRITQRDFKQTRKIRLLLLSQNNLRVIHNNTFSRLHILYELHLSNNSLDRMPVNLPRSLRSLHAVNNSIRKVQDGDLAANEKLETLLLSQNRIEAVSKHAFMQLPRLKNLDLSTNQIEVLQPHLFENTRNLEILDLSNNPIQSADHHCFEGLHNLHILQMSSLGGRSENLRPTIFKPTENLLFLDLSNSSQLAKTFAESPFLLDYISSVEDLNLMRDGIYTLPEDFPSHFPQLKTIKLVGNPWHCDRSIYWLTHWMNTGHVKFFQTDQMLCDSPPELRGRNIASLQLEEIPTEMPPRKDIKPDIDVIDIPFTLGKNYTLLVGEDKIALNRTLLEALKNGKMVLSLKPNSDLDARPIAKLRNTLDTDQEAKLITSNKVDPKNNGAHGEQEQHGHYYPDSGMSENSPDWSDRLKNHMYENKPAGEPPLESLHELYPEKSVQELPHSRRQNVHRHSKDYRDMLAKKRLNKLLSRGKNKSVQNNDVYKDTTGQVSHMSGSDGLLSDEAVTSRTRPGARKTVPHLGHKAAQLYAQFYHSPPQLEQVESNEWEESSGELH